ncbi:hypothetical protein CRV24_006049 [Beauveria bassiana]|nr:hypothetical protein CRV24_006049 [Beauveria bassiana]
MSANFSLSVPLHKISIHHPPFGMKIVAVVVTLAVAAVGQATPVLNSTDSTLDLNYCSSNSSSCVPSDVMPQRHERPKDIIPHCALSCIESYVKLHTRCRATDYLCICNHKEIKDKNAVSCVVNNCGFTKARNKVYPAIVEFCK